MYKRQLLIPQPSRDPGSYSLSADARLDARQNRAISGRQQLSHAVASGETLWEIARHYRVGVRELAAWNQMAPGDTLRVGQQLAVWTEQSASAAPASRPDMVRRVNYSVRRGDSLYAIANRFNVSVNQINTWNKINGQRYLQPGQQLTLYVDIRNAP